MLTALQMPVYHPVHCWWEQKVVWLLWETVWLFLKQEWNCYTIQKCHFWVYILQNGKQALQQDTQAAVLPAALVVIA